MSRKNFGSQPMLYPQPVLIIATYDENGKVDLSLFRPILFDGVNAEYYAFGEQVGNAFHDGEALKERRNI